MGTREKKIKTDKLGFGKLMAWQSRSISSACCVVILGFTSIFYTGTLGLSPVKVGMIMMFCNILDAITDLTAGFLVDRTNTKLGKGRPYELCIIGVWISTWLLFSCPTDMQLTAKYVWVFTCFIFVNSIFNTLLNSAQTPYMVRVFNKGQLVKVSSYGGMITMLGSMFVSITFPILMGKLVTGPKGWSGLVAIYALPLAVIGILRFIFVKEEFIIEEKTTEKVSVKIILKVLCRNPYVWMAGLGITLNGMATLGAGTYFYTYVVGDVGIMGLIMGISIIVTPVMFIVPRLLNKMPKYKLIMIGLLLEIVGALLMFAAGKSIPVIIASSLISGIGILPITFLSDLLLLDCCTYNEQKGLPRLEGSLTSFRNLLSKCGGGIAGVIMGVLLEVSGFVGGTGSVQPDSAILMIRAMMSFIPAFIFIVIAILIRGYGKLENNIITNEKGEK